MNLENVIGNPYKFTAELSGHRFHIGRIEPENELNKDAETCEGRNVPCRRSKDGDE